MRTIARRSSLTPAGLVLLAVVCALMLSAGGCTSSEAAASQGGAAASTEIRDTPQAAEGSDLLDSSLVHEISVSYEPDDYDAMVAAYRESGEKEWIEATVTIDGETYENVGLRLKGNSSLMNLRRSAGAANAGAAPAAAGAKTTTEAGTTAARGANAAATTTTTIQDAARGGWRDRQGPGGPGGDASFDDPTGLPWLIDLDRNVDGQNHQGVVELCVRSNTTETALNEAVSLGLLEIAGLATEQAVAVRFSVNGSDPQLRLVIENLDDVWMAKEFALTGALYKAESTGDYSYRGEDPDSYDEVFDQEAGKANADLTPLIEFLDFVNNSDDATFNAGLPARLDIEAFATYLAFEDLIANADDIDGMGNNSYLYYDPIIEKFTVVAWDHNLAFGGMGGMGGAMGGGDRPTRPGTQALPGGQAAQSTQPPGGGTLDGDTSDSAAPDAGAQARAGGQFGRTKSNILVERFKANPEWQRLYEEKSTQLKGELFASGKAAEILDSWVALLKEQASDLVDAATVDDEAAAVARYFSS